MPNRRSDRNGLGATWGLRLLALALAVLAWFVFTVGQRERLAETTVETFVTYNSPESLVILDAQEKVRVRVRGPASRIARLNPFQFSVVVELRGAGRGRHDVPLSASNVVAPGGLEVLAVDPTVLTLQLDREIEDLKPVDAQLTGEPAAGAIAQDPTVIPLQALVRGPESRVNQLSALTTTPVNLDGHALDFEEAAAVISPDPLVKVLQPAVVTVKVRLDIPPAPGAAAGSRGR